MIINDVKPWHRSWWIYEFQEDTTMVLLREHSIDKTLYIDSNSALQDLFVKIKPTIHQKRQMHDKIVFPHCENTTDTVG